MSSSNIDFSDVNHQTDNKNEIIYQKDRENGRIKSKIYIFRRKLSQSKGFLLIPKWILALLAKFFCCLFIVFLIGYLIFYFGLQPGVYKQSCIGRSCAPGFNLKCLNGICDCETDFFYYNFCQKKKSYLESCHVTSHFLEYKSLICLKGKCVCDDNQYWNGNGCFNRKTYREVCTGDQCLNFKMLFCDNELGLCSCESTRLL